MFKIIKAQNLKELSNLASEIWIEYQQIVITNEQIEYMLNKFQSEEAIKKQIQNDNYEYFFLNQNNENIGYIGLSRKTDFLFLSKFYIKKDFRKMGFWEKAFLYTIAYAKQLNYERIILTVNKNNTDSIEIYKKLGFKIIDSVITEIGNGYVMDDYIMEYKI